MIFLSDNSYGASVEVLDALRDANDGSQSSYGTDDYTKRAEAMFNEAFECDVTSFLVTTGTAANGLALAAMTPSYRAVLCHEESHVFVEECAAVQFQTGGAKTIPLEGDDGKITVAALEKFFATLRREPFQSTPVSLTMTQSTEFGGVYSLDDVTALSELAHANGLKVHMDGARFANALVSLGCTAAELTWKAGVDALTFGATKNGAMALDAVLFFDHSLAESFNYRRLRSGQLWSKGRYLGAQACAYLEDDLWLRNARQANDMAARLVAGLERVDGVRLACPCQANEVFVIFRRDVDERLRAAGALYYEWPGEGPRGDGQVGEDEILCRLVTSFQASEREVDDFLAAANAG